MNKPVIIIGASTLGKAALDIFKSNGVVVYGFLDDDKKLIGTEIEDTQVLGTADEEAFLKIIGKDCDVFIASDDNSLKASQIKSLRTKQKAMPVNAIHTNASIAESAILHHGSMIHSGVVVGAFAEVGNHCILHPGSIVDHEAKVGDFVQIGTGTNVCSGAQIEDRAFIGSGVTIVSGVKIEEGARVGAGSVVIADVKKGETVFGNPATVVKA